MATVLIVDDEEAVRDTFAAFLRHNNHTVEVAQDAASALDLCGRKSFDVVVSDLLLPGTSGLHLLERLIASTPLAKVILVTGAPSFASVSTSCSASRPYPAPRLRPTDKTGTD